MKADSAKHEIAIKLFEKVCERLKNEDLEKAQGMLLVGPEELRVLVREEIRTAGAPVADESALADRLWDRLQERPSMEKFIAQGGDISDRVIRIVDRRIEQFLDRQLKSKELGDRISGIVKSDSRLLFATSVERLQNQIEAKVTGEIKKAIDDLLRSQIVSPQ